MEQDERLRSLLKESSLEIGISLETEQIAQFMVYLNELRIWNQSMNLTSITTDEEIIIKHFADSLAGLKVESLRLGASLLDIGSGAGFPGIPLRIVRKDLELTLVEPVQKKISFLYYIVGVLRLERVKVFYGTLERFIAQRLHRQSYDYITTRALKYDFILRTSSTLLVPGGKAIIYSSLPLEETQLENDWSIINETAFNLPRGLGRRVISVLSNSQKQPV